MQNRLKKIYMAILSPALVCFTAAWLLRQKLPLMQIPQNIDLFLAPAIFILTAVFGLAGPILYRSYFAHAHRHHHEVSHAQLFSFECVVIGMILVTPYLALAAYVIQLPRFHLAATILMALYAIYYHYPSQRRIAFDKKIFRTPTGLPVEIESGL